MAFIRREQGGELVLHTIISGQRATVVSAVQLVEVEGKLVSEGRLTPVQVQARIQDLGNLFRVVPFGLDAQQAAGFYYARRRPYNLSLGDALCLGLAEALQADVMTAEHEWASLPNLPFQVLLLRDRSEDECPGGAR